MGKLHPQMHKMSVYHEFNGRTLRQIADAFATYATWYGNDAVVKLSPGDEEFDIIEREFFEKMREFMAPVEG